MSEEEIAAVFFVGVQVVKQRLKLASVSPKLLDAYAEDGMTLDQLLAFTVNPVVVGQWPSQGGHYPVVAYQTALGLGLVFQAAALVWFAMPWIRALGRNLFVDPLGSPAGAGGSPVDAPILEACAESDW